MFQKRKKIENETITINTNTGYNGRYVPRLKFERPSEVPPGTEVLKVIDCVGKVVNCGC